MRIVFSIITLFGLLHSINAKILECNFKEDTVPGCDCEFYGCFATELDTEYENEVFDSCEGIHEMSKYTEDVLHLSIRDSTVLYLPARLDLIFNLSSLLVMRSSLLRIESKSFIGLEDLIYLHLGDNHLTVIPNDAFSRLSKLKNLILTDNHIQELTSDVFKHNLNLESISLYNNRIKFIGQNTFKKLNNLEFLDLTSNKCMFEKYEVFDSIMILNEDLTECENTNEGISVEVEDLKVKLEKVREENRVLVKIIKEPCDVEKCLYEASEESDDKDLEEMGIKNLSEKSNDTKSEKKDKKNDSQKSIDTKSDKKEKKNDSKKSNDTKSKKKEKKSKKSEI